MGRDTAKDKAMTRRLSWKRGYVYCAATTKKGHQCGNKTVKGTRYCHVHRGRS